MSGPLDGIKVLDLTSYIAGPFACGLLADLGAEVIKIEAPDGDMQRRLPSTAPRHARAFLGLNRRKKGLALNLKSDEGKTVLRKLVATADVLVENFRPGVMARLGLDYESLRAENPSLIYFAISGYGSRGPLRSSPGFDTVLQTFTGIAAFQGAATDTPPHNVSGSILDYYAASMGALGVVAALHHRARTGQGQYAETSLLATSLTLQAGRFVWVDDEPREVNRDLNLGKISGIHPTKEGHLFVSAHAEHFWQALCEITNMGHLARDPRYDSMRKRTEHAAELVPQLREALSAKTALEWEALMAGRVPSSAARSIEDMFDHPQVAANGLTAHMTLGDGTGYRGLSSPIAFGATPVAPPTGAPSLGEHSDQILTDAGFDAEAIAHLRSAGVVA
ncbi:CoA transferase [Variovorax sp. LjRoot290]|uniref:CaiB/BaiF CoA transferase family protein n=1 Tax=Variovorax sp. LjRoot290 TaxID=3342316 RepID=UPI003ECD3E10